jgi:hypothetical protein
MVNLITYCHGYVIIVSAHEMCYKAQNILFNRHYQQQPVL